MPLPACICSARSALYVSFSGIYAKKKKTGSSGLPPFSAGIQIIIFRNIIKKNRFLGLAARLGGYTNDYFQEYMQKKNRFLGLAALLGGAQYTQNKKKTGSSGLPPFSAGPNIHKTKKKTGSSGLPPFSAGIQIIIFRNIIK